MLGPGLGGIEVVVIAIVALIVVGPKDLPLLLRKVGAFIGRMRAMATDFRASFDEMARQSELDDLRKEVEALRSGGLVDKWTAPVREIGDDIQTSLKAAPRPFAPAAEADTLPKDSAEGMTALPAEEPASPPAAEPRAVRPFAPPEAA